LAQSASRISERIEVNFEGNRPSDVREGNGKEGPEQTLHRIARPEANQEGKAKERGEVEELVENGATEESKLERAGASLR
jgi:hypothetical protein